MQRCCTRQIIRLKNDKYNFQMRPKIFNLDFEEEVHVTKTRNKNKNKTIEYTFRSH